MVWLTSLIEEIIFLLKKIGICSAQQLGFNSTMNHYSHFLTFSAKYVRLTYSSVLRCVTFAICILSFCSQFAFHCYAHEIFHFCLCWWEKAESWEMFESVYTSDHCHTWFLYFQCGMKKSRWEEVNKKVSDTLTDWRQITAIFDYQSRRIYRRCEPVFKEL